MDYGSLDCLSDRCLSNFYEHTYVKGSFLVTYRVKTEHSSLRPKT